MRRMLVMLVDPHICLVIRARLQRYGFRVSIADGAVNGFAALDHGTFDLMVIDIFMPHMRGFESIRIFRERAPTTPLIAASGYAFRETQFVRARFPADGARARRVALSAQTVHAGRAADRDQRMSFGKSRPAFQASFRPDSELRRLRPEQAMSGLLYDASELFAARAVQRRNVRRKGWRSSAISSAALFTTSIT
jgi:CheY-like chemotaxis protein